MRRSIVYSYYMHPVWIITRSRSTRSKERASKNIQTQQTAPKIVIIFKLVVVCFPLERRPTTINKIRIKFFCADFHAKPGSNGLNWRGLLNLSLSSKLRSNNKKKNAVDKSNWRGKVKKPCWYVQKVLTGVASIYILRENTETAVTFKCYVVGGGVFFLLIISQPL